MFVLQTIYNIVLQEEFVMNQKRKKARRRQLRAERVDQLESITEVIKELSMMPTKEELTEAQLEVKKLAEELSVSEEAAKQEPVVKKTTKKPIKKKTT